MSGRASFATKVLAAVAVVLAVVAGLLAWRLLDTRRAATTGAGTPGQAVERMLAAYAACDSDALLAVTTHDSVRTAPQLAVFRSDAARADKSAGTHPLVRAWKLARDTESPGDRALVQVTAEWLTDPAKGTYTKRTEQVPVVKRGGVWLVYMY